MASAALQVQHLVQTIATVHSQAWLNSSGPGFVRSPQQPVLSPLRPLLLSRYPDIRLVDVADGREAMDAVADRRADAAVEVKLFANLRINGDNDDRLRTVAVVDEVPASAH